MELKEVAKKNIMSEHTHIYFMPEVEKDLFISNDTCEICGYKTNLKPIILLTEEKNKQLKNEELQAKSRMPY